MRSSHGSLPDGTTIAGYTVLGLLGSGGMGSVYLARHPRLSRNVALKVLPYRTADPDFPGRFVREAELASRLDHPNIVHVLDTGSDDEHMWLAMQYVDGPNAAQLLEAAARDGGRGLEPERALDILRQVAAGIDDAHSHGMLHRDIKPANILVTDTWDGTPGSQRVFVSDFGIARSLDDTAHLTQTGTLIATLDYAAPELIEGTDVDVRADVCADVAAAGGEAYGRWLSMSRPASEIVTC